MRAAVKAARSKARRWAERQGSRWVRRRFPAIGPIAAAAGLAVGAYTGAFAGAVKTMGDAPPQAEIPPRPAGVRVVAHVPTRQHRECVLSTFERHHARSIEEAEGTWRDGSWVDFDPVSVPRWIKPPPPQ